MVLIIDGNNTAYRALYTVSLSHKGQDTSILFGVIKMVYGMIKKHRPRSVIVCFDGGTPPFRRQLVPSYKMGRTKSKDIDWDDVRFQMDTLHQYLLPIHGVLTIRRPQCEADDLMYHAAQMVCDRPYIVTTDQDLLQAVDQRVSVYNPIKGKIYTADNFQKEIGVPWGEAFLFYKVLVGDSSDGIPGVPYIGEKTAAKLVNDRSMAAGGTDVYSWLCHNSPTRILNKRQRRSLLGFGIDNWRNAYDCMDLSLDRCGAHKSIQSREWNPADKGKIQRAMFQYGFESLLELGGEYTAVFTKLTQPQFKELRHPSTLLFEREPV